MKKSILIAVIAILVIAFSGISFAGDVGGGMGHNRGMFGHKQNEIDKCAYPIHKMMMGVKKLT